MLITGGFDASASVRQLADETETPLISSSYDSFTIAPLINRAVYDRMITKEIIRAEDVMAMGCLLSRDPGEAWPAGLPLYRKSRPRSFPRGGPAAAGVVGIITAGRGRGQVPTLRWKKVMTKKPHTLSPSGFPWLPSPTR